MIQSFILDNSGILLENLWFFFFIFKPTWKREKKMSEQSKLKHLRSCQRNNDRVSTRVLITPSLFNWTKEERKNNFKIPLTFRLVVRGKYADIWLSSLSFSHSVCGVRLCVLYQCTCVCVCSSPIQVVSLLFLIDSFHSFYDIKAFNIIVLKHLCIVAVAAATAAATHTRCFTLLSRFWFGFLFTCCACVLLYVFVSLCVPVLCEWCMCVCV